MSQYPLLGKTLRSRYRIVKLLGSGGFGDTYLTVDLDLPGQPQCVVKHLKPKDPNPAVLPIAKSLFEREAQVLYQLGNDNDQIPQLFAHFEENGEFYLVQEFVDGHDLIEEIIPGLPLSENVVLKLLKDILEVLAVVHQHNVIHRDIKPQNLMRRNKDGKIVLIDFGAVKEVSALSVNVQGQTSATVAIGTPFYMPGEQGQGQPRLCSDIYAVGILNIQALTGLQANQLPKDPHTGEITWRNQTQVSQKLAEVLEKMVRYDFRQRYQSAAEVLQALQGLTKPMTAPKFPLWKALIGLGIAVIPTIIIVLPRLMTPSISMLPYDNSAGISIQYPKTWQLDPKQDPITGSLATFLSPKEDNSDIYIENLSLTVNNLPVTNATLDEYTKEIKQYNRDAVILEEANTTLANRPAYQIVYTKKEGGRSLKRLQVWTVKDNKVYVITYTAESDKYSNYLAIAQKMISSFEIK